MQATNLKKGFNKTQVCQPNQKDKMQMSFLKWYFPLDKALTEVINNYLDIVAGVQNTKMFQECLHFNNLLNNKNVKVKVQEQCCLMGNTVAQEFKAFAARMIISNQINLYLYTTVHTG